jgi:hypothetical protein
MGTEFRVRYDSIPAGRQINEDMFADLGASLSKHNESPFLRIVLDVDLSEADRAIALARLANGDDDRAVAAVEAADVTADVCLWEPDTETTVGDRIAALEAQVEALTRLCTRLAQINPNVPL